MSFVVTTHNPLTLHGARPGEVYVMCREDATTQLEQRDIRPGHHVDHVLFEQFGIRHTFDSNTRDMLDRHMQMLLDGVPAEDPQRRMLEAQLQERFGSVADTLGQERAAAGEFVEPLSPEELAFLAKLGGSKGG
jgi:hypothetical protein